MSEAGSEAAAAPEAVAGTQPLGEQATLAEFRARRDEAPAAEETKPATAADGDDEPEEADAKAQASEAGKALNAKKKSLQGRIDEITAEKHQTAGELNAARRELAELREELASLRSGKPAEPKTEAKAEAVADPNDPEPKVEDFDDYQKYVKAVGRWEARQAIREQREIDAREAHVSGIQQAQDRVAAEGAKAHEDFDAVMTQYESAGGSYSDVAVDAISRHPLGHELAYAMAKDPGLAKRINGAPTQAAAIYELGRAMARIEADAEGKAVPERKPRATKAPAPIGKADGGEQVSSTPDLEKMSSLAEFRRVRDKIAA